MILNLTSVNKGGFKDCYEQVGQGFATKKSEVLICHNRRIIIFLIEI